MAQYRLLPEEAELASQSRRRRQGNIGTLRSSLTEELSLRFRTENENGMLFSMSGSSSVGDSVSIQVRLTVMKYRVTDVEKNASTRSTQNTDTFIYQDTVLGPNYMYVHAYIAYMYT